MRRDAQHDLIDAIKELNDIRFTLDEHAIVVITDAEGQITYANDKFCKIAKYSREELLGQDHRIVNSGHHPKEFFSNLWTTIQNGRVWKGIIKNKAKDGSCYWVDSTIVPFVGSEGKPYQYVAIRTDVTEQMEAEKKLKEYTLELEQFNHLAVGRELTMIDLKKQINQLLGELNRQPGYDIVEG
ncbi:MAG TPA: PAS domain S-box protein [Spirochaetes bacterium]|nr:PAS domain S-box protein [Spirochaetota bacterium]